MTAETIARSEIVRHMIARIGRGRLHDSHAEYEECCSMMFAIQDLLAMYHLYATRGRSTRGKGPCDERGPLRAGGSFQCCSSGPTWSSSFSRSASRSAMPPERICSRCSRTCRRSEERRVGKEC